MFDSQQLEQTPSAACVGQPGRRPVSFFVQKRRFPVGTAVKQARTQCDSIYHAQLLSRPRRARKQDRRFLWRRRGQKSDERESNITKRTTRGEILIWCP